MDRLQQLFADWAGEPCTSCLALGASGSSRRYYRLSGATHTCIGTVASDRRENEAFFAFTRHFRDKGLPVPELYLVDSDRCHYLQQDLGDQTLYSLLYDKRRQGGGFDAEMMDLYRQALADLAAIQQAGIDLDYSVAYPCPAFDSRSIHWDLNYFKYFFLKLLHIDFDEDRLEEDFDRLVSYLLSADCHYFLYRDFNPRNIMLAHSEQSATHSPLPTTHYPLPTLYYIDYQGGRRGAAQYDVASLLYSAKSDLPEAIRTQLLNHYLDVRGLRGDQRRQWLDHFWAYLLTRILQTLGAYGYRGLYERKDYFIQSIPLALNNLQHLLQEHPIAVDLPEIRKLVDACLLALPTTHCPLPTTHYPLPTPNSQLPTLTVSIGSFSYKQGLPHDPSGNGGGFIFDCRALPNPGRYPQYKSYTGKDRPVIEFLEREPAVLQFLDHCEALVAQSIDKYLERHFTHLLVSFGCTGGQHRSVYCAEQLARRLANRYPHVSIALHHREQD
ncbi:MAG: phosphotransferase [Bacteroidales bacterium]|nr:phosphotransferase [Bacteroidales bacterium]